jgi:hypothetical protein
MSPDPHVYVYALAAGDLPRRVSLGPHILETIDVGDVRAIVESLGAAPAPSEEALRDQYGLVADLAGRAAALLPVRFGTFMRRSELERRLGQSQAVLADALRLVAGRVQMTVRVLPDTPAAAPSSLPHPLSGAAYLAQRRAQAAGADPSVRALRDAAAPFVVQERVEAAHDRVPETVFHLIDLADVDRYLTAVEPLSRRIAPHRVTVSGPWPAFAFGPEVL